ncbi:MAG: hypothetical protein HY204_12115 [Nitrospirae bacterium]|nr:hypothetical protein [Nitrospirota bacterium]
MELGQQETALKGRCVTFLVGQAGLNLETTAMVESRALKSSPNYPDVVPRQAIVRTQKGRVHDREAGFVVKAYLPDTVIVEAMIEFHDLAAEPLLDLNRDLLLECRRILNEFQCNPEFDEEYSVYCISDYQGDPEMFLALHGEKIASLLKKERIPLDEEEIKSTLRSHLKYGKDDLTIVDWDGAFLFDPQGDFEANIELFEITNLQLLKSRILDDELDGRLKTTLQLLRQRPERSWLRSKQVRSVMREIIQTRTTSILESQAIEHSIKLIGDWYTARLYALISKKFHLDDWRQNINEKLDILEDVYSMAAENFSISFNTTLEFILIGGWFILQIGWFALLFLELYLVK